MLSLADAILQEDMTSVLQMLSLGEDVNQIDEYGFRPIIEAAIVDNIEISKFLLENGADPNQRDATGGSALHWAAENNNVALCTLLLKHGADPNSYNNAGQPVLTMPLLRRQRPLRKLLSRAGADLLFAQDFINTKLLGHMFELVGFAEIIDPTNKFVDIDFEGFFLEVTLGLVADSLSQFQMHFAARQWRRYLGLINFIVQVIHRSSQLIKYQQYRVNLSKHEQTIDALIQQEPLIIPVGYEGHAITFIKYEDIWVKCDRREDSRLYDNIMFYRIHRPHQFSKLFVRNLIYEKRTSEYVNEEIDVILGLEPITELKIESQISGNCTWANVEACIPAIFFLVLMQLNKDSPDLPYFKTLALNFYHRWREWNKDRALDYCLQSFREGDTLRKASKAEILAAILFQSCNYQNTKDQERIEKILAVFANSPYLYILQNYVRIYYYENYTEEGRKFSDLLKEYGFLK